MYGTSRIRAFHGRVHYSLVGATAYVCLSACLLLPWQLVAENVPPSPPHASVDRSGELRVTNAMTLHLTTDLGNVRVQTLPQGAPPVVRYTVHVETDAPNPLGQRLLDHYSLTTRETVDSVFLSGAIPNLGLLAPPHRAPRRNVQFWVQFVVTVPATFNLEVSTGAGDVETADIAGRVALLTQGGNITAGRIGLPGSPLAHGDRPVAKFETEGGHITLKDVAGDVDAYTAGGHIQAGNIDGNAKLRTGGGHIRATRIKGTARLETDGGNITIGEAGSYVGVRTAGGQIDFGEVHGSVHAETGGGGIRVMYVAGPMEVATTGGSICLTRVANKVHAETGEGTITAWINPETSERAHTVRLPGPSQLASHTGDIVVFLPRNIAMAIDATVETGGPSRIEADPSLPLSVQTQPDGPVHAMASLNGGGALLKLRTTSGKIQLQYLDAQAGLRQSLLDEQKQRLAEKLSDYGMTQVSLSPPSAATGNPPPPLSPKDAQEDWFNSAKKRMEVIFMGSIHEDYGEFKKRLTSSPTPEYPTLARKAGIQGRVVLQIRLKADGSVSVERVLEGEPALIDAAIAAIRKWRGKPEQVSGKSVEVVSTMSFNFQPH
ncbi:MAG: TonB family protein [Candidatus Acidiferrum sp.]